MKKKINRKQKEKLFNQLQKGPNSFTRIDKWGNEIEWHKYETQWVINDKNEAVHIDTIEKPKSRRSKKKE